MNNNAIKKLEFKELLDHIRTNNLKFFNFYNVDIDPSLFFTVQYYNEINEDVKNTNQKLSTLFLDIEAYKENEEEQFDFSQSLYPVTAITLYFNKKYITYFLNIYNAPIDIPALEIKLKKELVENDYIPEDESISIEVFTNELQILKKLWDTIKQFDPAILSGWNSDKFDFPYLYRRILKLTNNDEELTNSIVSRFGEVKVKKDQIFIPEYNIADLLYLYKPRDDGGRNYGKKQLSYSLDYIASKVLNLRKLDYKSRNINLNQLYEQDPENYIFYNIIDVVLCVRLEERLQLIPLHNTIRRTMKCPFEKSLIGQSAVFDSFAMSRLNSNIRYGLTAQNSKTIEIEDLENIKSFRTAGKKGSFLEPESISSLDYSKQVHKFDGAYVTQPLCSIKDKGITFSLDATSMYPNIMLQYNISFDSYKARILPNTLYKFIRILNDTLGKSTAPSEELLLSIFDLTTKYINRSTTITQKAKTQKTIYYTATFLLSKIYESKLTLNQLFKPINNKAQILLSHYLIHLLDLINLIHIDRKSYNDIIFTYLFNNSEFKDKYSTIFIIKDARTSFESIIALNPNQALDFIKQYIVTITGTCFLKHDIKPGLFTEMLQDFAKDRSEAQKEMDKYSQNSEEYQFYNNMQNSFKILMNSNYGVQGLRSFRFSNSQLAHTITTQGKLTIKLAQYVTDNYLKSKDF